MKLSIKLLSLVLLWAFFVLPAKSQRIVEMNNDTVIVIKPKDVTTINCIIVDLELTKKKCELQDKIILQDSVKIGFLEKIVDTKDSILYKKEIMYNNTINNLEKSIRKEKREKYLWTGAASFLAIIFGILSFK